MVCGPGTASSSLGRGTAAKYVAEAAEADRQVDDGGERRGVDQDVLDDRDRGRRAQPAGVREHGQNGEGDEQWQVARDAAAADPERPDDDLQPHQLQSDIGQGRGDAGQSDRQGQPAIAEAAAHEVRYRDVAVPMADLQMRGNTMKKMG